MNYAIKRRLSDRIFSEYVRRRDGRCVFQQRCYRGVKFDWKELSCCHFHSRRKESVRVDPQNADAGCGACHQWLDHTAEGQKWHKEFKLKQLGEKDCALLEMRANTPGKRDEALSTLYAKELLRSLSPGKPQEGTVNLVES